MMKTTGILGTAGFLLALGAGLAIPCAAGDPAPDVEDGFVNLFPRDAFDGWTGATDSYTIEQGVIASAPNKSGNLETRTEYSDFILRFEFQLTPGANNGIGLRMPPGGHAAYDGLEVQILDDHHPRHARIKEYQRHGSVYGLLPALKDAMRPIGEWNEQEIRCVGPRVVVILNGETIVDGDVREAAAAGALDGKEHPGALRNSGVVALLAHKSVVRFRNVRIQDLAP